MNLERNEIDMIAFESAVKVGGNQKMYSPYSKGTTSLANMADISNLKSDKYISR